MKRREFMQTSLLTSASILVGSSTTVEAKSKKPSIVSYRKLGKTDMNISDISFGAGRLSSGSLVLRAIDRGVNYIDTSPDYGPSEDFIGDALKRFKQRDKIYIASKFCHPIPYQSGKSHLAVGSSKADYIHAVENSLKRMGTDYLDVVFVHAMGEKADYKGEKARLLDETMLAASEDLKKAGKIRYLAVSSHGPNTLEKLMSEAVQSGHFDLIMFAFNFLNFPKIPDVLQQAKQKGVGVIAMKTLAGARESGAKLETGPFEQAAFKWVLKHPEVDGLVISIKSVADLDNYLPASGVKFTSKDQDLLDTYAQLHNNGYCRTGCGDCLSSCDQGVDIATILRYQMYFEQYGEEKRAMVAYSQLEKKADLCETCEQAACTNACPYGLSIKQQLQTAHQTLTLTRV